MACEAIRSRVTPLRLSAMGVVLAVVVALLWRHADRGGADPAARSAQVEKRTVGISLIEQGLLVSTNSVPVKLAATGIILEITDSGTRVKKADVNATLDPAMPSYSWHRTGTKIQERITELTLEMQQLESKLELIDARVNLATVRNDNDIKLRKEELALATLRLTSTEEGIDADEERLATIDCETAKIHLEEAQADYARQRRLREKGFVSASSLEPYEQEVASARTYLQEQEINLQTKRNPAAPEKLVELTAAVRRLESLVRRGAEAKRRAIEALQLDADAIKASITPVEEQLKHAERALNNASSLAPADGLFFVRMSQDWARGGHWVPYGPGASKNRNDVIADIVTPGSVAISVLVHASDAHSVHVGSRATIRIPAIGARSFQGAVIDMSGIGSDRYDVAQRGYETERTGVTLYTATVRIDDAQAAELHPGMSAIVEIAVEPATERLVLPREMVREENGAYTVLRQGPRGPKAASVQGRPLNNSLFEITNGLDEGDTVAIFERGNKR